MSTTNLNGRTPHTAPNVRLGVLVSYVRAEEKAILAVARARGLDSVQAENENRSDAWLAEFREQLAALAAADLSRLGVEVLPAAVAGTAGRRFRLTQLKRVDGYSARYDDDGDMDA